MKILCVIEDLGSGGAQRQLVNLAINFKKREHEVNFLVHHSNNFYVQILNENNIPIKEIVELNKFRLFLKIRNYLRSGNYDAVLSFLQSTNFICELASMPSKKWSLIVGERSANPAIMKSFKLKMFRLTHLFSNYVVANSFENINIVKKIVPFIPKKKLQVIYNMVDFSKWSPSDDYVQFKNGIFNMTIVASHRHLKNLNGLIEATNLLSIEEKKKLQINWYGSDCHDNSKSIAIKKINDLKLNHIFNFHNSTIDISKKVQLADAIGLFSFYEGLPNVICEAMAVGKPVICSRISDIPKIVLEGENGFLCDPNNSVSMKNAISLMLQCDNESLYRISQNNILKAQKLFDSEKITEAYIKLMSR